MEEEANGKSKGSRRIGEQEVPLLISVEEEGRERKREGIGDEGVGG